MDGNPNVKYSNVQQIFRERLRDNKSWNFCDRSNLSDDACVASQLFLRKFEYFTIIFQSNFAQDFWRHFLFRTIKSVKMFEIRMLIIFALKNPTLVKVYNFWRENSFFFSLKNLARFARKVLKWDILSDFHTLCLFVGMSVRYSTCIKK